MESAFARLLLTESRARVSVPRINSYLPRGPAWPGATMIYPHTSGELRLLGRFTVAVILAFGAVTARAENQVGAPHDGAAEGAALTDAQLQEFESLSLLHARVSTTPFVTPRVIHSANGKLYVTLTVEMGSK